MSGNKERGAFQRVVLIGFKKPTSRRAHFVEFGTVDQQAQPFIRPALDSKSQEGLDEMVRVMREGIEKEEWKSAVAAIEGDEIQVGPI